MAADRVTSGPVSELKSMNLGRRQQQELLEEERTPHRHSASSLLAQQQQLDSSQRALCCEFQGMPLWMEVPAAWSPVLSLGGTFASLEALSLEEEKSQTAGNKVIYGLRAL